MCAFSRRGPDVGGRIRGLFPFSPRFKKQSLDVLSTSLRPLFQFMLPNSNHTPTSFPQQGPCLLVAGDVPLDFFVPVVLSRFRPSVTTEAPVPKTSIDKNGQFLLCKGKVRPARQIASSQLPTADSQCHESSAKTPLCGAVTFAANSCHHSRTMFWVLGFVFSHEMIFCRPCLQRRK